MHGHGEGGGACEVEQLQQLHLLLNYYTFLLKPT